MSANAPSLLLVVVVLGLLSILLTGLLPWWLAIPLMAALGIILGLWARLVSVQHMGCVMRHARRGRGAVGFGGSSCKAQARSACNAASIQTRAFSSKIARSLMSGVSAACLAHSRAKARYSFGDVHDALP